MASQKTILITGCSQGGLGDALAQEFASRGQRVIATGRNMAKLEHFKAIKNVETCALDVLDDDSIAACVSSVSERAGGKIDMLINNSGGGYSMPLMDVSMSEARKLYDLNVWSVLAVTKAFMPLLLRSTHGGVVVNQTSVVSVVPIAYSGIYSSSKAAAAMMTDVLRFELEPFGVKVVELKTGGVRSRFFDNQAEGGRGVKLPEGSMYTPARKVIETGMSGADISNSSMDAGVYARRVVGDLLSASPPTKSWRGNSSTTVWFASGFLPTSLFHFVAKRTSGLDKLKAALAAQKKGN